MSPSLAMGKNFSFALLGFRSLQPEFAHANEIIYDIPVVYNILLFDQ